MVGGCGPEDTLRTPFKRPPSPPYEGAWLKALRDYFILYTAPEKAFDDMARLAAHILSMQIALVLLVDEKRQ